MAAAPWDAAGMSASTMTLPGPLSNASVASRSSDTTATLAMPPMFCSARTRPGARNRSQSAKGRSGAPSPPWATSATRKSPTVTAPVRAAITAGSPSCSVEATPPIDGGWCHTVWPWLPTRIERAGAGDRARGVGEPGAELKVALAQRRGVAGEQRVDALPLRGRVGRGAEVDERDPRVAAEALDVDERGVDAVDAGARHEADHALVRLCDQRQQRMRGGHGYFRCARMRSHSSRTAPSPPGRLVT